MQNTFEHGSTLEVPLCAHKSNKAGGGRDIWIPEMHASEAHEVLIWNGLLLNISGDLYVSQWLSNKNLRALGKIDEQWTFNEKFYFVQYRASSPLQASSKVLLFCTVSPVQFSWGWASLCCHAYLVLTQKHCSCCLFILSQSAKQSL